MNEKVILLVEDDQKDEALTLRALRRGNVLNKVVVAHDGAEACDYLFVPGSDGNLSPLPRLILCDLKMPRIDGFEVLQRIREDNRTRLLPVVILTTSAEEKDRFDGYRLGANSFVRKPVDFLQFVEAVRQLGLYWLGLNEPPPDLRGNWSIRWRKNCES